MSDDSKRAEERVLAESGTDAAVSTGGMSSEALLAERIKELYRSPAGIFANLAIAMLLAVAIDPGVPANLVIGWVCLMAVVMAVRFGLWRAYRRARPSPRFAKRWARRYETVTLATGLVWALTASVAPLEASLQSQGLVIFAVGGMMAAAIYSLAAHPPAFYLLILPAALPILAIYASVGEPLHLTAVAMGSVYTVLVIVGGRAAARSVEETLRLRLENLALNADLLVARRSAYMADRIKRESLANLSHELRTPLNAIIGFADSMQEEIWGPLGHVKYREYVRNIADSGNHLFTLISDILDLSRAEVGSLELSEEPVDLARLAETCRTMVARQATERELKLSVTVDPDTPWVMADAAKLRQVVINLLANALKFTLKDGEVNLMVHLVGDGGIEIAVSDTGIGIDTADLERVMEPFVRLKEVGVYNSEGAGLGLALSRRLMELHGGGLTLESKPGVGTTARAYLPPSRVLEPRPSPLSGAHG